MVYSIADNIISPLGSTTADNYQAVLSGSSALGPAVFGVPSPTARFTCGQRQQQAREGLTAFESLAVSSIRQALSQVFTTPDDCHRYLASRRLLLVLATTKANIALLTSADTVSPKLYPGTAAQRIARHLGISTTPVTVCNACCSGLSAIILAQRMLQAGYYDNAIVCGADLICPFIVEGFHSLRALSEEPCRPFDLERRGMNLGEAAATMLLTTAETPRCDVSTPLWTIRCGAIRNDAYQLTAPAKDAQGARLALEAVCRELPVQALACINAHGTGTLFNDQMEAVAIRQAGLDSVPVNALKGYFGHTLGAAGILETVLTMHATAHGTLLGTKGYTERGVSAPISVTTHHSTTEARAFVKMISGFGGCNAALLAKLATSADQSLPANVVRDVPARQHATTHTVRLTPRSVSIDGRRVCHDTDLDTLYRTAVGNYPHYFTMDPLSRLAFVAAELLLQQDQQPTPIATPHSQSENSHCNATLAKRELSLQRHTRKARTASPSQRAIVLFSHSSSIKADRTFLQMLRNGSSGSGTAFVHTLPNIAATEIAIRHHYQGETTVCLLPCRDDTLMQAVADSCLADSHTRSILWGWTDYDDDNCYEAELYITEKH